MKIIDVLKIAMLLLVVCTFQNAHSDELRNFDRKTIAKNKVKKVREILSRYEKGKEPKDYGGSCIVWVYKFDQMGNLTAYGLARVGTEYGYRYNNKGELIDWTWKDHTTGKVTYFSDELKKYPIEFKKGIEERKTKLNEILEKKFNNKNGYEQNISDICGNVDAIYKVKLVSENNGLPLLSRAIKKQELDHIPDKNYKSPRILYIYYEYTYHDR